MMKLHLFTLFTLVLWALPSWAARKNPESPINGFSSPQAPAQKVPAHLGKRRKLPMASELILGKGVAEGTTLPNCGPNPNQYSNSDIRAMQLGGLIFGKKTQVKDQGAPHRSRARKNDTITHRNVTPTQARKIPSLQALLNLAHKNDGQIKEGKEPRNVCWALHSHRNTSCPSTGKEHATNHQNASLTLKWHSSLTRNNTWAQGAKKPNILHRNAKQALSMKKHSSSSISASWTQSWQKQNVFQRNVKQTQANKKPNVTPRHVGQAFPGKSHGLLHRNTTWVETKKEPTLSKKNASWTFPKRKTSPSFGNVGQALTKEKIGFSSRNASQALPGKRFSTQHINASWTENKWHKPHQNVSWALPKKNSSSCKNLSLALAGTRHRILHLCSGQTWARNISGVPFRNTTQIEAAKDKHSSHKNIPWAAAGTPRWQPALLKDRDALSYLPTTCLLSERAVACGNAHLKQIPKLNDPGLQTLFLAENEITRVPAGIFLGLPNLEWLDLSKNKLDSTGLHPEAFKNLIKLKRLNLDGNQLTTIPDLPSSLQELKFNDNNLERLQKYSFRGLFKLLTLELEGNQLHDGNVLSTAFKPLMKLIYLRLNQNNFRAIPPGLPASLQELHLHSNSIEEVSESVFNKTLNLILLDLSNNKLQEDRIAPRAWIDLPNLETLDLSHNHLVHVPSFLPRHLKQLTLHHNRIERIPGYVFAHIKPGLEFLHLSHNALQDDGIHAVSFFGLHHSLTELLLDNNQLQAIPRGILNLKGLQVLRLSHNRIRHVPLNSVCDTRVAEDSNIMAMHLENNLIDRRRIPPTAFSCIKAYHSVVLRPQQNEDNY